MACVIEWSVTSPWAFFSWLLSPFFAFHHHLCSCGGSTLGSTRLHSRNVASAPWAASGLADPTPPKKRVKPGVSLPPCGPAWWVSRSQSKSVSGFQNWGHGHEGSWYTQSHGRAERRRSARAKVVNTMRINTVFFLSHWTPREGGRSLPFSDSGELHLFSPRPQRPRAGSRAGGGRSALMPWLPPDPNGDPTWNDSLLGPFEGVQTPIQLHLPVCLPGKKQCQWLACSPWEPQGQQQLNMQLTWQVEQKQQILIGRLKVNKWHTGRGGNVIVPKTACRNWQGRHIHAQVLYSKCHHSWTTSGCDTWMRFVTRFPRAHPYGTPWKPRWGTLCSGTDSAFLVSLPGWLLDVTFQTSFIMIHTR